MATKKKENKVWYAVDENIIPAIDSETAFVISDSLEESYKELMEDRGESFDKNTKLYAFKIELLGEIEQTIKIKNN